MPDFPTRTRPTNIEGGGFRERLANYDSAGAANRALLALAAGNIGSWSWDFVRGTVMGDRMMALLFGLEFGAQPWPQDSVFSAIHPDDLDRVQGSVQRAIDTNIIFTSEFRKRVIDPVTGATAYRWLSSRGNVTERDEAGQPTRMFGVNWDITDQKKREDRSALMAAEMDHRVKNAFAVIRALINLGVRADGTKQTFAEGLRQQVEAMATAHEISAKMARESDIPDAPVPVDALFHAALSPWMEGGINPNCTVTLQSDVSYMIHPRLVSSLSMIVYELATNAAKYGALGERGGALAITVIKGAGDTIRMDWDETCNEPPIKPLKETGFGSRLIAQCASMLGEIVHHEMTADGLSIALIINTPKT